MKPETPAISTEPFELSGGALCLDFANTWGNHLDPESDRLRAYVHLLAFARQAGFLDESAAVDLNRTAGRDPESATAAISLAREIRQVIYRLFSNLAGGRGVPPQDMDRINAMLGEAFSRRRIEKRDGGFVWSWEPVETDDLRAPLWPIIESAANLLTSDEAGRIQECDAEDCNWLFLDRSRSGTRRWCSMKSCGNRAKARRHYLRQRRMTK